MSDITSTQATGSTAATGTSGSTVSRTDNNLGENDFLQLMMVQLQNQDPLNPSDPTQYLSELANFSTLEQETQVAKNSAESATQQQTASALGLLGHTVTYTDDNGNTATGTVTKVDFTSSGPSLTVGGASGVSLSDITEVS